MTDSRIRLMICGAMGNMGVRIIKTASETEDMEIVGAVDQPGISEEGEDVGKVLGIGELGLPVVGSDRMEEVLEEKNPDVMIDFTVAEAAVENVEKAAREDVPVVVGTTGFSEDQRKKMEKMIENYQIPAVISSNMSPGVNVFFKLVEEAADKLEGYDMELIEAHHNEKVDAPSGTALTAARMAAEAVDKDFEKVAKYGRGNGRLGEREKNEIGIHSIRAGNISGDHTFLLAGDNERLEITHRAQNRQVFVDGTMKAIRYIVSKGKPGRIVNMMDILFGEGKHD